MQLFCPDLYKLTLSSASEIKSFKATAASWYDKNRKCPIDAALYSEI